MDEDEFKDPTRETRYKIILWGLVIHCLLLFAVFDLYFASPLDQGMTPVKSTSSPPAKRLVLIIADGLRAEAVIGENKQYRIPFLTEATQHGTWGVAHTRVPTESRPGHVAMMAGIYEDPSAIFKGWKANPVNFDSVVPQSANAWCWGSPDIVNLFNKDKVPTVHTYSYSAELEDFGKRHTGFLDTWVYREVEKFFKENVQVCENELCDIYYSSENFFFMHLLGIDTAGHGYKPYSKEYIGNIKLVDEITRNITNLFETTFKDHSTAYIVTSDHGMTDWGSHGAGSLHETEVPIFAWGAGIKINPHRQDISQIDIAPLISSLIGINIPINSLGILPISYLNVSDHELAKLVLSNILQILKIFDVKRLRTESNAIVYIPFKGISNKFIENKLNYLRELERKEDFSEFIKESNRLMNFLIRGVSYYHNYYQFPILISISGGFLAWLLFLSMSVFFSDKQNELDMPDKYDKIAVTMMVLIAILLCYKQKFPLTYYLYFSFPIVMSALISPYCRNHKVFSNLRHYYGKFKKNLGSISFYFVGIELLIYGFFNRFAFTVLMVLIGSWIILSKNLKRNTNDKEKFCWVVCCSILAIFPCLPVMRTSFNVPLYVSGFLGWICLFNAMYLSKVRVYYQLENMASQYRAFLVQFCCLIMSAVYVLLLEHDYISNDSNIKYISWLLLVVPVLMIPLTSTFIAIRLVSTFFAFAPFYLLVSPNYEVIFSVFYVALLCTWLLIESKSFQFGNTSNMIYYAKFETYRSKNKIDSDVFRRGFLFMVFIFLGFFGTGNIASLNSFDPMWVRAFLTIFSPFKMMGLIMLKFMVPFIFTCCIFRAINSVGKENILNVFCIILIFSDCMVLQFLYLITNEGSWLDIGTSLSHFVIMEGFVTILLVLYGIAHLLTTVKY